MTYYTTKCPHCGTHIKIMSSRKHSHGNPFKVCNQCGQTYVDPYCLEDAFKPYKKSGKFSYVIASLFGGLIVSFPVFAVVAYFSNYPIKTVGIACGILFVISFVLFLRHSLSNYEQTEAEFLREWQESDARLRNPEHVKALVKAGFDVPEKYKAGIEFEKVDPYKPDASKFICSNCGTYSSGWHQTCPKCGATGKMEKTTDFLQRQAKKKRDEEQATQLESERARKKYICKQCGVLNSGWYQTCPNCGAVGKMELIPKGSQTKQVGASVDNRPQTGKRFICRSCGKTCTGWYQNCPNCGVAGKMEAITISSLPTEQKEEKQDAVPFKIDSSLSEQLRQLKSLFDDGIITQEEFDAKKKQLLGL